MKTKRLKKYTNHFILAISSVVLLQSCTPQSEKLYSEAYDEIEKGHFRIAVDLLERSAASEDSDSKRTKAILEAARIARFEIQDFDRAIRLYRQVILKSHDARQRVLAQETLAEIYFENLQNYTQSLAELLILEQLSLAEEQKERIKFRIAQCQFLTGHTALALEYIDSSLKSKASDHRQLYKLKGQILVSQKRYDEALVAYEEIRKLDPTFFTKENLYIATSIVYEEKEDYQSALLYLDKYQSLIEDKPYLELRMKRLKEKQTNKPLFKGRRK